MSNTRGESKSIPAFAGDAANVLLVTSSATTAPDPPWAELCETTDVSRRYLLTVTYADGPTQGSEDPLERAARWTTRVHVGPAEAATSAPDPSTPDTDDVDDVVADSTDLSRLGTRLTAHLTQSSDESPTDRVAQTRLRFDSVTALLQQVSTQQAFRFLHILTTLVRDTDAVGQYHLHADACDARTVATLSPLFDSVLEVDGTTGKWTVRGAGGDPADAGEPAAVQRDD